MTSLPPACNASALIGPLAPSDVSKAVLSEPAGAARDSSSKIVSVALVNRPGIALLKLERTMESVRFGSTRLLSTIEIRRFVDVCPSSKSNVPDKVPAGVVKSTTGSAVPGRIRYSTATCSASPPTRSTRIKAVPPVSLMKYSGSENVSSP